MKMYFGRTNAANRTISEHIVIENIHDALRILTKETLGGEK